MALNEIQTGTFHQDSESLESTIHVGRDASTAHVVYTDPYTGQQFHGLGTAKRHPKDQQDISIGANTAIARALQQLATEIALDTIPKVYGD